MEEDVAALKSNLPKPLAGEPVLARLWTHWTTARGNRTMPGDCEVGAAHVPDIAPHMLEIDVLGEREFAYRFVGANLVAAYGFDPTGRRVDDALNAARRALARRIYALAAKSRRPLFARSRYVTPQPAPLVVRRVVLPAVGNDERVTLLVSAQTFEYSGDVAGELGNQATLDIGGDSHVFLDEPLD